MNVLAFTKYSYDGPSSRYRFYNYQKCFARQNIQLTIRPLFSKSYLNASNKLIRFLAALFSYINRLAFVCQILIIKKKYDLLLVEYELFPYFPSWFEYLFMERGIKYIVDYDDAIFHNYDLHSKRFIQLLFREKIGKVMRYAETVITCNTYLESYAKRYNTSTFRLPTVVLLDKYIDTMEKYHPIISDTFVVGWIGSRTTSIYILEILPAIKKFVGDYPNVRFDLLGFDKKLLSSENIAKHHLNIIK